MAKKAYIGVDGVARQIKKIYVGMSEEYTEVEYIESSGTQYIDTGFCPDNNTRVVMDVQLDANTAALSSLFGARTSATSNNYAFLWVNDTYLRSDYNNVYTQQWPVEKTTRRTVDKNKETTTVGGNAQSYTNASFKAPVSLTLLVNNNNGTKQWYASAKLYACQIYDNGVLVRDFVPCFDAAHVPGLFDKVNQAFYQNAGTGTFYAGPSTGVTLKSKSVARKVKKGYIGVNGVARTFFGGVTWAKYSTNSMEQYLKTTPPSGEVLIDTKSENSKFTLHKSYKFAALMGFVSAGGTQLSTTESISNMAKYIKVISETQVARPSRKDSYTGSATGTVYYQLYGTYIDACELKTVYSKDTQIGEVTADEGKLPEDGTLVEGSVDGSYCVLLVGDTYYYYEKV